MEGHVRAPVQAKLLGWAGVIPFFVGAGLYAWGPAQLKGPALLILLPYAAIVLSFLGGVRWGVDITRPAPRWREVGFSVLPPLAAWALLSLPFLTTSWQLGGFITAFLLQWAGDAHAPEEAPAWYRRARTPLTLGATVALAIALESSLNY